MFSDVGCRTISSLVGGRFVQVLFIWSTAFPSRTEAPASPRLVPRNSFFLRELLFRGDDFLAAYAPCSVRAVVQFLLSPMLNTLECGEATDAAG